METEVQLNSHPLGTCIVKTLRLEDSESCPYRPPDSLVPLVEFLELRFQPGAPLRGSCPAETVVELLIPVLDPMGFAPSVPMNPPGIVCQARAGPAGEVSSSHVQEPAAPAAD